MTAFRYTPGPWRAVVAADGVAVLPSDAGTELLDRVWRALAAGAGLGAVLESLTASFGTSLSAIPPFAVITVAGGEVRLAVRGPLAVSVTEDDSRYTVSGADVTTWSERVVGGATGLTVTTPDEAAGETFGIADGVVLCSALELELAGPAERPVRAAAPDATPATVTVHVEAGVGGTDGDLVVDESTVVPESTLLTGPGGAEKPDPEPARQAAVAPEHPPVSTSSVTPADERGAADEPGPAVEQSPLDEELAHTRTELPDDAYDHLWGATVVKSVEEAAVRDLEDDDSEEVEAAPAGPAAPENAPGEADAAPASAPVPSDAAETASPPPTAAVPPVPPTGLIDSVPGFSSIGAASGSPGFDSHTVPPALAEPSAPAGPAEHPAAALDPAGAPSAAAADADGLDHDGLTITVSELEAMRRLDAAAGEPAPALPTAPLGRIVLSTGESYPLDRPVIVGRRPRANRVQADQVPVLVTVASPEQDISRNHLEVRLEGRHVLAVDLATTNGSVLHREGTPPLRLGPNEPVLVLSGDVVDIGDGVTVTFEEIP